MVRHFSAVDEAFWRFFVMLIYELGHWIHMITRICQYKPRIQFGSTAGVGRYWAPGQKNNQKLVDEQQRSRKTPYIVVGETIEADQRCDRFWHCVPDIAGIMKSTFFPPPHTVCTF